MPIYDYLCPANGQRLEAMHGIDETVRDWGALCALTGAALGDTPADAPVEKLISAPGLSFPKGAAALKNMGFTKLVRRERGVYENVTAADGESRYVKGDDPATLPNLRKKIGD